MTKLFGCTTTGENEILIKNIFAHRTGLFVNDQIRAIFQKYLDIAVADPGFPRRGGGDELGRYPQSLGPKTYCLARFC